VERDRGGWREGVEGGLCAPNNQSIKAEINDRTSPPPLFFSFQKTKNIKKQKNSRSSSSQHLMPLRLRTHAQRRRKQQRKRHDEADLQRAASGHEEQHRGRTDQERDGREHEDKADGDVDARFAAEVEVGVVGAGALGGGGEEFLFLWERGW